VVRSGHKQDGRGRCLSSAFDLAAYFPGFSLFWFLVFWLPEWRTRYHKFPVASPYFLLDYLPFLFSLPSLFCCSLMFRKRPHDLQGKQYRGTRTRAFGALRRALGHSHTIASCVCQQSIIIIWVAVERDIVSSGAPFGTYFEFLGDTRASSQRRAHSSPRYSPSLPRHLTHMAHLRSSSLYSSPSRTPRIVFVPSVLVAVCSCSHASPAYPPPPLSRCLCHPRQPLPPSPIYCKLRRLPAIGFSALLPPTP